MEKFADITPNYIVFRGFAGDSLERIIRIKPLKSYPFKIEGIKAKKKKDIDIKLRELKSDDGIIYEIVARNKRAKKGRLSNTIQIDTDSKIKPLIEIRVGGYLRERPENKKKEAAGSAHLPE